MFASRRSLLVLAASAALLAACQGGEASTTSPADMTIGAANAPVHLVEYASATCPHCATFHAEVWPTIKANYVDTGRVRFTFREMATPPAPVAVAMFQVARCGGVDSDTYITRLGALFDQQRAILSTGSMQGVRDSLVRLGQAANLSEEQVMQCITDETGAARVRDSAEHAASEYNITGTPSFLINDQRVEAADAPTLEGMTRVLDAALAQEGG